MSAALLAGLAGVFALISGVNDGGALLATGLKLPSVRPVFGILALMIAVALVPLVSSAVARTFTTRLAPFDGPDARTVMAIAVVAALVIVTMLSNMGRPTSLTLAIVGAITGAGLGWGLPVSTSAVLFVLAVGIAAPFVGALFSVLISRGLVRLSHGRALPAWHRVGFGVECLAYAANDGQKMLAVAMIALGLSSATPPVTGAIAILFGIGAMYGLPRAGRTLGREIIASRPLHGVSAELAGGVAVIGCAAAGAPVSMTQALAGGLIGAVMAQSTARVRWHAAIKIVLAWVITLPASGLLAGAGALIIKGLVG